MNPARRKLFIALALIPLLGVNKLSANPYDVETLRSVYKILHPKIVKVHRDNMMKDFETAMKNIEIALRPLLEYQKETGGIENYEFLMKTYNERPMINLRYTLRSATMSVMIQ